MAIALCLVSCAAAATDDEVGPEAPEATKPTEPRQTQPVPSRRPAPAPQATFTPSEQIRADSSVPFPVDI